MIAQVHGAWLRVTSVAIVCAGAVAWAATVGDPASAQVSESTRITMKDFMFSPVPLTVRAGATVTWKNLDDEPHTAVSDTGDFRSGAMDTNDSFSFKFEKPGTYRFTCSIHPRMTGTIIVK